MSRRLAIIVVAIVCLLLIGANIFALYKFRSAIRDVEWNSTVTELTKDSVEANTGTMQFFRDRTLSMTFDKVEYLPSGLHLHGYVGNSSNIEIDSASLKFNAMDQPFKLRNDWEKKDDLNRDLYSWSPPTIGNAQTPTLPNLPPGHQDEFDVTIPNVKQNKDGINVTLALQNERYSYPFSVQ